MRYANIQFIEGMVESFPGFVFWKDLASTYVGCNRKMSLSAKFTNPSNMIGKTDLDCPWDIFADAYQADDQKAFAGKKIERVEPVVIDDKITFVKVSKKPIFMDSKVIGVLAYSYEVSGLAEEAKVDEYTKSVVVNKNQIAKNFFNLTEKEAIVLYFLIRGHSANEIGNILCKSKRTIETQIISIKMKFQCNTKSELVKKAFAVGFHLVKPLCL